MHAQRTDTDTHAQSTDACRCSVAMVKLGMVLFMGKGRVKTVHRGSGSAWRQ